MFLIDYILLGIGSFFLLFGLLIFVFSNKAFDCLSDIGLDVLFISFGVVFILAPLVFNLFFNRCDVCQTYVSSDYCTDCGAFVSDYSVCSCGKKVSDKYKFCPSCGCYLEVIFDEK